MRVKVENEKVGLKLNIQQIKIMASGPMILWKIEGEKAETVTDFIFLHMVTATVRTGHGTMDLFKIGKGVHHGCILLPCLFNLYAEYLM